MCVCELSVILKILCLFWQIPGTYPLSDSIAISCGSSGSMTALDGRVWIGDYGFRSSLPLQIYGKPSNSRAIHQFSSLDYVPYKTARVSHHEFSYVFSVNPGQKFIRLHFHQDSYKGFERSKALFTVKAGPFTLLSNFSTSLASEVLGAKQIIKEYCVNVDEGRALIITFSPATRKRKSDDFYAFVNGIEVVPMPTGLYFSQEGELGALVVGQKYRFYIDNSTALELVQRLNVGGTSISPAEDSSLFRRWDEDSGYLLEETGALPLNSLTTGRYGYSSTFIAPIKVYQTARTVLADTKLSTNDLTWKIPVDLGFRYLIRLHFSELESNKDFSIVINNQIAEDNANVIQWSGPSGVAVYRDYIVMMEGDKMVGKRYITITYQPKDESGDSQFHSSLNALEVFKLSNPDNNLAGTSSDPCAFVNGIEIVSVPMHLSFFKAGDIGVQLVGEKSLIYVENNDALEIIQRISIKHDLVPSLGDFNDLFPKRATQEEDKTKHDTWRIPVEVGFRYLIRIHFSKLGLKISGSGSLIFKILINEMTAHTNMDILKAKDDGMVLYRDYIVMMRGLKKDGKRDLLIRLESYDELLNGHGVVAGFEIVKLSNPDNSLASPNPLPPPHDSPSRAIQIPLSILGHRYATATLAIAILSLLNIVVHKLRESWEDSSIDEENKPSSRAARLCRHFSLSEIRLATRNFSDGLFIGRGGFGKVYKGLIDKGKTTVAIKRLNSDSKQGAHEFLTEIETLSELRHKNLAPLIGYCSERGEMILVYEYMPCGTLSDHLYKLARHNGYSSSLTWKQRLNICIGAAQGLAYLHTEHRVIHRDVKASNILLNESFVAKVSDFGLAKHEDKNKSQSQELSTRVKGTNGYLDPHYFLTCKLSRKSDTYAFGVVLLEALCGRPAVDIKAVEDEQILTKWARYMISKGEVDRIVDSSLRGQISPNSLNTFVRVAERCLDDEPKNRPTMSQIVLQLDDALEQQDNNNQNFIVKEIATTSDHGIRPSTCNDQIEVSATAQPAMTTTDMQNLTLPPNEQTDSNVVSTEHTSTTNKSSRVFPFWNRAKASKRNEVSLSERTKIKLPKFDWNKIVAATNYFSNSNMVGRAGFGSLYKAVLPAGEVVAVKIIPNISKRGQKDFKKQIGLLPNLEHQNIVKVLGYCAHKEDKMLVHDFMENTSLDC